MFTLIHCSLSFLEKEAHIIQDRMDYNYCGFQRAQLHLVVYTAAFTTIWTFDKLVHHHTYRYFSICDCYKSKCFHQQEIRMETNCCIIVVSTNPRTGMCTSLALLMTSANRSMLSSIEQLIFFLLKVSDADPNTATSVAPAATFKEERSLVNCFHTALESHLHKCKYYVAKTL